LKFLVKVHPAEGVPLPPEQALQLNLASMDYWEQQIKSGKVTGAPFAGKAGGGGVLEVGSPEELHAILQGSPAAGITRYEVEALTTFEAAKKAARQQLEALKKA